MWKWLYLKWIFVNKSFKSHVAAVAVVIRDHDVECMQNKLTMDIVVESTASRYSWLSELLLYCQLDMGISFSLND